MRGDVVTILMIIGGIVILISVLVIGIYVYQSYRWGPCWANFNQKMGEIEKEFEKLKTQESAKVEVTMGDCVGALIFTRIEELKEFQKSTGKDYRKALKCTEGKGFILGLPYFEETRSYYLMFWRWHRDAWEDIEKWFAETVKGIGPICRSLDREVSNTVSISGPMKEGKTKTVCIELMKIGPDKYGVDYKEGACA